MSRAGTVLVVAGPDGSGKTTVADAIAGALAPPVLRLHHRPQLLPSRTGGDGPVTDPHGARAYPRWLSALKVCYLFADYALGWLLRIRPLLGRGGTVVLERGWWDLLVDSHRYRLAGVGPLVRLLGALLPRPDITVVLEARPEVLLARKQELPEDELARQLQAWRGLRARGAVTYVDTDAPMAEVIDAVRTRLRSACPDLRWAAS